MPKGVSSLKVCCRVVCAGVLLAGLLLAPSIWADSPSGPDLSGIWGTKFGDLRITQTGTQVVGVLTKSSGLCPFAEGTTLLEASVLDDSLAGTLTMCQADTTCGPPVKAHTVLLIARQGQVLSGSAHSKEALCPLRGFSRSGESEQGLYFTRQLASSGSAVAQAQPLAPPEPVTTPPDGKVSPPLPSSEMPGPPATPGTYDPRRWNTPTPDGRRLLLEGKQFLNAGRFEQARQAFEQALEADPGDPVALVGVGVSWYGRKDYDRALDAYKRAIAADPNFGMAYYNTACVYALQGRQDMALRWLKIAFLNGFVPIDAMREDPDLRSLHGNPEYQRLLEGGF